MKRILLIACVLGLAPPVALAQGTVYFGTTSPAHRVIWGPSTPVGGFIAALYWAPLGSLEGDLIQLGATTGVTGGTGFLVAGGTRTTGMATAEGANALFQVRAWTASSGATWEQFLLSVTGFGGKSAMFENPTSAPNASPPTTPAFLTGWTAPILVWTPEPSSLALITLGLGALGLHRRWASRKLRQ